MPKPLAQMRAAAFEDGGLKQASPKPKSTSTRKSIGTKASLSTMLHTSTAHLISHNCTALQSMYHASQPPTHLIMKGSATNEDLPNSCLPASAGCSDDLSRGPPHTNLCLSLKYSYVMYNGLMHHTKCCEDAAVHHNGSLSPPS